ncbi:Lysophospholipase, alpha-beta hydrolase superfamily [Arthrobacter alpinus]|uniref:Lysophospholipase, alpha-beta hydrolase superfamily n=1 Tax=Arthrobacter alpinus TaxID=656366 RepID=A0A1H5JF80_9MICC|nr:alpha/beta hydrolase [Arthrobacter alpinus]SEE51195.1 Lysophospholipase, alpha-beta hydrolase superfamily [Arthrobacter alpinus]
MNHEGAQSADAVEWVPDILGPDYQATTLALPLGANAVGGGEDPAAATYQATLIRHRPRVSSTSVPRERGSGNKPPVLFIHGWSDYFYNTGLAEFFTNRGYPFYAVDLHNHGRSLGSPELGGYVADLSDYDAELLAAHTIIAQESGGPGATGTDHPVILMGHSTGGLTATLWAHHHPGLVSHLLLNSPWLEIQGGPAIRRAATPLVQLADLRPLMRMRVPERSFYWRGISSDAYGEWPVDKKLRPPRAFPVRAGWMKAILAAQQEVAAGLKLPMPVLVLLSSKSMLGPVWSDGMLHADVVLDVRSLALRTLSLGNSVTLERIDGALHEVFLSNAAVRTHAYERLERWLRGYVD